VIAQCTVDYLGRLTAHLPSARRLLLVKADGSVSVHADDRAYKPLNWMSPPCWLTETLDGDAAIWVVQNKAGEQLRITLTDVEHDSSHELGTDPGLVKDEIKRRGEIDGVEQLTRYLELLNRDPLLAPVAGVFAAQQIKPQARTLAEDRGIRCLTLDYDSMRGMDNDEFRLF
jgi:RecB family endonuclease NucS